MFNTFPLSPLGLEKPPEFYAIKDKGYKIYPEISCLSRWRVMASWEDDKITSVAAYETR